MDRIKKFKVVGLFGNRDVEILPRGNSMILVGPNGIGKSSVINIFYFFISRQWSRLMEYKFDEIVIAVDDTEIHAHRSDITGLSELNRLSNTQSLSPQVRNIISRLSTQNLLDEFVASSRLSLASRKKFSDALVMPVEEVTEFHRYLWRRLEAEDVDLFKKPRLSLERALAEAFPSRTLYLPTYRRIEKDLREIFPDFEERYRSHTAPGSMLTAGRSSTHYIDLVSFGMEDVKRNFSKKTQEMRDYSLELYNNLSGLYLRDVIRGVADKFTSRQIDSLTDDDISDILGRVNEKTLPNEDKELLRKKVKDIQGKKKADIDVHDRFLAHYFNRLVSTNSEITARERDIASFVDVCNAYLNPRKRMVYDEIAFKIQILDERGGDIDLSLLSSGEKQVVSLFSHLYLDDAVGQVVVIDEPELSLSVPWQQRFLTDILASEKCSFIVAVTHSPFIYQNDLKPSAFDLRRKTKIYKDH